MPKTSASQELIQLKAVQIADNAIIPMKDRVVDEYYDPLVWIWRKITGKSN